MAGPIDADLAVLDRLLADPRLLAPIEQVDARKWWTQEGMVDRRTDR